MLGTVCTAPDCGSGRAHLSDISLSCAQRALTLFASSARRALYSWIIGSTSQGSANNGAKLPPNDREHLQAVLVCRWSVLRTS